MNNYIQKIVEDFNFNSIRNVNDKAGSFAENILGVIDLGLPSGLLWCECNLGANFEYEYGDYYAWGELTTKSEYTEENYTFKDNPNQLQSECDVATQTLGENYSIPTKEQWNELLKYTKKKWVENYKGSGVNGMLFMSKTNNNSIFIPIAGFRFYSSLAGIGSSGGVWSASLLIVHNDAAWYLGLGRGYADMCDSGRYYGRSVRPVFKK